MKISIITATYNRIETLPRALLSVQAQDYTNKELVVVDGGSIDGSVHKIRTIISEGDLLVSERDDGVFDALNKGIKLSSGEIIGIMHSDDFYADDTVLTQVCKIFEDQSVDLVYGDVSFFNADEPGKTTRVVQTKEFSCKRLSKGFMPAHTATFFRRSIHDKFGLYKSDYKVAGDYDFMCRLATSKNVKSAYLPRTIVRMQQGGLSTRGIRSVILNTREVLRACRENGIKTNVFILLAKYPFKVMELFKGVRG